MLCSSKYPTKPKDLGLENFSIMEKKYSTYTSFSDHSGEIFFIFNKSKFGGTYY